MQIVNKVLCNNKECFKLVQMLIVLQCLKDSEMHVDVMELM